MPDHIGAGPAHLVCDRITKRYGDHTVLDQVSLTIHKAQVHALIGGNGAGKSTLARMILGEIRPDEGEMLVNGNQAVFRSPRDALDTGIGGVTQEPTLVPALTVLQNVFLGCESFFWGRSRPRLKEHYAKLAEQAGWHLRPALPVACLGVADRQKVEILRCLARNARLIVFDEPTAALDATESQSFLAVVQELRRRGTTILYITHILEEVTEIADTVSVLNDGVLAGIQPTSGLTPKALATAMTRAGTGLMRPTRPAPVSTAPEALRIEKLTAGAALTGLDLTVREGEILGLISNTATAPEALARALNGRGTGTARITIGGTAVTLASPRQAIRAGIILLPSDREREGILRNQPLAANITLPSLGRVSRLGFIGLAEERSQTLPLRAALHITASPAANIDTLSGGNRQKTIIARCLMQRPKILIANHPTRGIDPASRQAVFDLLHSTAESGAAVILISNSVDELILAADRIAVLKDGNIICEYPHPETLDRNEVTGVVFGSGGGRPPGTTNR
ncbi:sugar ABC transporter ATP-binding protein [Streptomyces sp. NPDC002659]|uniref:sugar ABC transporter ATP-binding protein n=1 Tax=Streptomyces sp. NPDC002659 TaxID=3364656 RepID=UPI0036796C3F